MFSHAVSSLSRLGSWNTMPNRWRTSFGCAAGSSPSIVDRAAASAEQRRQHLDRRRLAGAVGPEEREDLARARRANEMSLTACTSPKVLVRLRTSIDCWWACARLSILEPFQFRQDSAGPPYTMCRVTRRPAFWLFFWFCPLGLSSPAVTGYNWVFPQAFSIVALDIIDGSRSCARRRRAPSCPRRPRAARFPRRRLPSAWTRDARPSSSSKAAARRRSPR